MKNTKRRIGMLGAALLGVVAVFGTALPSSARTVRAERREERRELRDARGNLRQERRDVRQARRNGNPPYGNAYGYRRNRTVRSSTVYNRYGYNDRGYNRAGRYNARFDQRR